jgi:hypothetical protein
MRIDGFFCELRGFAVALEDDCAALRKAVVGQQPRFPDGSEQAIEVLRLLHDETSGVMEAMDALEKPAVSMAAVVEAAARILQRSSQQLETVEKELAQYGFKPLPGLAAAAATGADDVQQEETAAADQQEEQAIAEAAANETFGAGERPFSAPNTPCPTETVGMNSTFVRETVQDGAPTNEEEAAQDEDATTEEDAEPHFVAPPAASALPLPPSHRPIS